jgi:rhodanese-related sulfurtransferase
MSPDAPDAIVAAEALSAQIDAGAAPLILDVRSGPEFSRGHVPGAVHIPFWALPLRARELRHDQGRPIVVYCGHGPRAAFARQVLHLWGFRHVACLAGHMAGWRRARLPIVP